MHYKIIINLIKNKNKLYLSKFHYLHIKKEYRTQTTSACSTHTYITHMRFLFIFYLSKILLSYS